MTWLTGFRRDRIPEHSIEVFMDQNTKCNLRCRMCAFSDPRVRSLKPYDMPFELFEKVSREVFPFARYVTLSCLTEPLMTRDLPARLELLASHAIPFTEMITNGALLNEEMCRRIVDARLTRLGVSIDGASAATYESVRVGASFDRLLANLETLQQVKARAGSELPRLRILVVLTQRNVDEFDELLALATRLGAHSLEFRTITPFRGAEDQGTEDADFWTKIRACRETLDRWHAQSGIEPGGFLRTQAEKMEGYHPDGKRMVCERACNTAAIHPNGDVVPCIAWTRPPMGNLLEQDFTEIWNGKPYRLARDEFRRLAPGLDCNYCTIILSSPSSPDDRFFSMLAKPRPEG